MSRSFLRDYRQTAHMLLVKLAEGRGRSALPVAVESSQTLFTVNVPPPDGVATFAAPQSATWGLLNLPDGTDLLAAMAKLRTDERLLAAELNRILTPAAVPLPAVSAPEPFENQQDWLTQMNAYEGWRLFEERFPEKLPSEGIVVAVLDSGMDVNHPDLKEQIVPGRKYFYLDDQGNVTSDEHVMDEYGHGTHVSGVIGARRNSTGIVGVAPGVNILPVRVLNEDGHGDIAATIAGVIYATTLPEVKVLNISLRWPSGTMSHDAITLAQQAGKLAIVAAGTATLAPLPPTGTLDGFADAAKAGDYATNALRWAVGKGIISGKGKGILDPKGNATRAQVSVILMRYLEKSAK